jgi:hypothetical protein
MRSNPHLVSKCINSTLRMTTCSLLLVGRCAFLAEFVTHPCVLEWEDGGDRVVRNRFHEPQPTNRTRLLYGVLWVHAWYAWCGPYGGHEEACRLQRRLSVSFTSAGRITAGAVFFDSDAACDRHDSTGGWRCSSDTCPRQLAAEERVATKVSRLTALPGRPMLYHVYGGGGQSSGAAFERVDMEVDSLRRPTALPSRRWRRAARPVAHACAAGGPSRSRRDEHVLRRPRVAITPGRASTRCAARAS